ncbi:glycosyltransferase [Marinicella sp. S1101]|uniref:glycosyltransferase n=1 Tax=Marinicella marina TaxID=2996016 RepID=UPI002260A343|nr:glycosyltransferase [Marinicella marina]MCX7553948.1 glycosyltransferase [Marinicella marina]
MSKSTKQKNTLVIHDLFQIKGGGERLVSILCQQLGADLLTGHIGQQTFQLDQLLGHVTDLNAMGNISGIKTWRLARAFKHHTPQSNHQNVIYSGVAAPLAIKHHLQAQNIFYCHTPPRFVYDKRDHYQKQLNFLKKPVFKTLINWFQPQYEQAVSQMDHVLTNSKYVQNRIKKHLNIESTVVYPPCDTESFKWRSDGDYFLSLARHDTLKRIDVIIEAFKAMPDKKLVVASGGEMTAELKQAAAGYDNIVFTGWLSDVSLLKLLGECLATIYIPEDEDFGMSPVESMSAGKAVLCSDHGGLLESVIHGETGFHIDNNNLKSSLIEQVKQFNSNQAQAMRTACEQRAASFDTQHFMDNFKKFL